MKSNFARCNRRSFFLGGGAVLGAGVATAATAVARAAPVERPGEATELKSQVACEKERDAIRQLNREFMMRLQTGAYEKVVELFDEQATLELSGQYASGRAEIQELFDVGYRNARAGSMHAAYRQTPLNSQDAVVVSEDRLQSNSMFAVEVELVCPLQGDSTVVQMARLQGQVADRRWVAGRFEGTYVYRQGQWWMQSLRYVAS